MLFWRRKGKETKDVEKEMVPPKEEARKETPKKEVPKRVVEGGNYGPGFVANLLVAKGCDSMPFYRLEKQFARLGIPVARSTMARLFHLAIERHLHPLASRILELIR